MGGVLEKLLEKARKEPEKYRDLLLEEKRALEAGLRHCSSWLLTLGSLLTAYMGLLSRLRILAVSVPVILIALASIFIVLIIGLRRARLIRKIREILYGDPMDEETYIKLLGAWAIACGIIALLIALLG